MVDVVIAVAESHKSTKVSIWHPGSLFAHHNRSATEPSFRKQCFIGVHRGLLSDYGIHCAVCRTHIDWCSSLARSIFYHKITPTQSNHPKCNTDHAPSAALRAQNQIWCSFGRRKERMPIKSGCHKIVTGHSPFAGTQLHLLYLLADKTRGKSW